MAFGNYRVFVYVYFRLTPFFPLLSYLFLPFSFFLSFVAISTFSVICSVMSFVTAVVVT